MIQKYFLPSIVFFLLFTSTCAYIDIPLNLNISGSQIAYNIPMDIDGIEYAVSVSLQNKQQFLMNQKNVIKQSKAHKHKKQKNQMNAILKVTSLEGYTFQGWKRFFMEALLYIQSRYYHELVLHLSDIKLKQQFNPLTNGLMSLGPHLQQNNIFSKIKLSAEEYVKQDIISFYTSQNGKEVRMQIGGYEVANARGHRNGILFYVKPLEVSAQNDIWFMPIQKIYCTRDRNSKWQSFALSNSNIKLKLTLESQYMILPVEMKQQIQSNFETQNIQCKITEQLQCTGMNSIDLALTFLSLELSHNVFMNLSLYDLVDKYYEKERLTTFFVKLSSKEEQYQLSANILKPYYVSLNMKSHELSFSPINRFKQDITSVDVLRFIVLFGCFMLVACLIIIVWIQISNPKINRKVNRGKEGIRLVSYQRTHQEQESLDDGI